jgi:hypothetical protein
MVNINNTCVSFKDSEQIFKHLTAVYIPRSDPGPLYYADSTSDFWPTNQIRSCSSLLEWKPAILC